MVSVRSVAIIGGGIGGLTVANTLMRTGMSVSVYERSPYFIPTAGAGLGLQPNGQISLAYCGLKDQINKILHPYLKWQIINDNGEIVCSTDRLNEYSERFGYYIGGAVRAQLIDILKEPLQKSNTIHYSHTLQGLEQDKNGVTLSFENGKQTRVDMVIGADGIGSTVAAKVFSQTKPPIHSKENIFYGVIDNIDDKTTINPIITNKNTLTQYFGRGEFLCYRMGNDGQFMWAATYPSDAPPTANSDAEWTEMISQRELSTLLKRYPQSHPIHQCALNTNPKRLLHFGLFYRAHRSDGWHRNRVCLLGDACHATLPYVGQGANMAIEDAVTLALCLEKHDFHTDLAFKEYFNKRFNRTKRIVNAARYLGLFLHSENLIVNSIRARLLPRILNSSILIKMAEKEFYENCPVPPQK